MFGGLQAKLKADPHNLSSSSAGAGFRTETRAFPPSFGAEDSHVRNAVGVEPFSPVSGVVGNGFKPFLLLFLDLSETRVRSIMLLP